jgi:hypothetical protein
MIFPTDYSMQSPDLAIEAEKRDFESIWLPEQTSWVKLGAAGVDLCLTSGANDLGGTLMNESISRAAGAEHGQEMPPESMERFNRPFGSGSRAPHDTLSVCASRTAARIAQRRASRAAFVRACVDCTGN